MNLQNCNITESLSDSISICQVDRVEVLYIKHKCVEAGISLFGGHLLWFKPKGQNEVLWLSDDAIFNGEKAIRGGVPICFPWFGNAGGEQTHGFARNVKWDLIDIQELERGVQVTLELVDNEETRIMWPHKFKNTLTFVLTNIATISLLTENTDEHPWSYSGAIHTYFGVGDITNTIISGVGTKYLDGTENYIETRGENVCSIDKEVIRVCTASDDSIVVCDSDNQRDIVVKNSGHNAAVVWNPWKETTKSMTDMPDEDYSKMLCVESTIFGTVPVSLEPGSSHALETTLSIIKS